MPLEHYKLDSVIVGGKYSGFSVRQVYQFAPDYIEWIIKNWEEFYIDLEIFRELPKPTPFVKEQFNSIKIEKNGKEKIYKTKAFDPDANNVRDAIEWIKEGGTIAEKDFYFSEASKQILKEKLGGVFIKPKWARWDDPSNLGTISLDSFAD